MSGGRFGYIQHTMDVIADDIEQLAREYESSCEPLTVARMREAAATVKRAAAMIQRVDWFASGDDGEESFNERWVEDGLGEQK